MLFCTEKTVLRNGLRQAKEVPAIYYHRIRNTRRWPFQKKLSFPPYTCTMPIIANRYFLKSAIYVIVFLQKKYTLNRVNLIKFITDGIFPLSIRIIVGTLANILSSKTLHRLCSCSAISFSTAAWNVSVVSLFEHRLNTV